MNVKNIIRVAAFAFIIGISLPTRANSLTTEPGQPDNATDAKELRAQQMIHRLEEIRDMDKSTMTRDEKKALRKEVKEIRKEARRDGVKGVYISIGALIIIVLLLILII